MVSKFSVLVIIAILITAWILINPQERFGFSFFGLTTYSAVPIPYFDLWVYPNGVVQLRDKLHFVSINETREILNMSLLNDVNSSVDALIIGTGYDNLVVVDYIALNNSFVPVYAMPTPDALEKFNEMKDQNKRVAAIIHTTC